MFGQVLLAREQVINSPSRREGITLQEETKRRKEIAQMIQEAGMMLR
jgi:hypothetical protein